MGVVTALSFLRDSNQIQVPPFCVLFGDEAFLHSESLRKLRTLVLSDDDADFSLSRFDGTTVSYIDVLRETSTMVMFGAGRRLILVEQADQFVSQNRDRLEDYLESPSKAGVLVLQVASFPSNLRLYKKALASGLLIDCKALSPKEIQPWLVDWARKENKVDVTRDAASELIEFVGNDMGTLAQEIRRLSLIAPNNKIDGRFIGENVGDWRLRKVWDLVDSALDGNTAEALRQLDKLINSGEVPIVILAQIAATLRKLSAIAQIIEESDPARPPISLSSAIDKAGVRPFLREKMTSQFNKLGIRRARVLSELLLQTDVDIKGGSRSDPRLILERFIVQISNTKLRPFETLR